MAADVCTFPFSETGFYNGFEPLNEDDIMAICSEIEMITAREKYQPASWAYNFIEVSVSVYKKKAISKRLK